MLKAPLQFAKCRLFSSAPNPSRPITSSQEVKRHIHRLYQHIHPDRLVSFPKERLTNETSFQVLQSALDRYFKPSDETPSAVQNTPCTKLTFFARSNSAKGLCKAVVTFHENRLATVLHDLFAGLGLEPPPRSVLSVIGPISPSQPSHIRLKDLVHRARQAKGTGSATRATENLDGATVSRLATERACGIRLSVCNSVPLGARATAAERVRDLLTSSCVDSTGMDVIVNGGTGVLVAPHRWAPRLILGVLASQAQWLDVVTSTAFNVACMKARDQRNSLREAERSAASAIGVRLILCNVDHLYGEGNDVLLDCYADIVSKISEQSTELECEFARGSWRKELAVMVNEGNEVSTDVDTGLLRVGAALGAKGVVNAVAGSQWLSHAHKDRRQKKEAEEKFVADTRRLLKASRLYRKDGLPQEAWEVGLRGLRRKAVVLKDALSGVSVMVGVRARVVGHGEVEIPYNFEQWCSHAP